MGFKFFSIQTRDWFYDTVTYKHALLVEAPLYLDLVINSHIIERTGFVWPLISEKGVCVLIVIWRDIYHSLGTVFPVDLLGLGGFTCFDASQTA